MADGRFAVRCAESAEDLRFIRELSMKVGWRPGFHDMEALCAHDPNAFFIGILDGTRISCVSVAKYSSDFSFLSFFVVEETHRGKGYGSRTFSAAMASAGRDSNTGADGFTSAIPILQKRGFVHQGWANCRHFVTISKVVHAFAKVLPVAESHSSVSVKLIADVDFEKLAAFDQSIFPIQRRSFLEKWTSADTHSCWAAVNQTGDIFGYVVIRRTLGRAGEQHVYKLGPLLAENTSIAKVLLYTAAQAASAEAAPDEKMIVDAPIEGNPGAVEIIHEVQGEESSRMRRLFTKQVVQLPVEKIFAFIGFTPC